MKHALSHCASELYAHDRLHFYQCLFAPAGVRQDLFVFYALNLELARIPGLVSEEMIGHIRYAWWQETLEDMVTSGKTRGQPVVQELAASAVPRDLAIRLVEHYRECYPEAASPEMVDRLAADCLHTLAPQAVQRWLGAQGVIARHRARHGSGRTGWLAGKLLIKML